jgi:hypothetical protein
MKKWNERRFDYLRNYYNSLKIFLLQFQQRFLKQRTAEVLITMADIFMRNCNTRLAEQTTNNG